MKLNKTLLLLIIYIVLKIASYIDFHNSILNTLFGSKYLRYLLFCIFFYKILELIIKIYRAYVSQDPKISFIDRATLGIKNGFIGYNERIGDSVSQEFSMFYYAFFSGKKKSHHHHKYEFTYYQKNTALGIYWAFIFLTIIETGIIHYLLFIYELQWINGILLVINLYTMVFFLGHIKAMKRKPITIDNEFLTINNGLFISQKILINEIESIYQFNEDLKKENTLKVGLIGKLEAMNTIIELKNEKTITLIYGIKRKAKFITFHIDNYIEFSEILNKKMEATS